MARRGTFPAFVARSAALVRVAFLEAAAEPVSMLLALVALLAVHLAPGFQFHRFGEPGRLARDGGLSALLVFGLSLAATAAVRAVGRELDSGTATVALSRPVPRPLFLCAKAFGVFLAFLLFAAGIVAATVLSVSSSILGSAAAGIDDGTTRVSGPCLVLGFGGVLAALFAAAAAHRFARRRFGVVAFVLLAAFQILALAVLSLFHLVPGFQSIFSLPSACDIQYSIFNILSSLLPAAFCVVAFVGVFVCAAAALAVRLRPAAVAASVLVLLAFSLFAPALSLPAALSAVLAAFVPDFQNFWLADALARGGSLPAAYVAAALSAAAALAVVWLLVGSFLLQKRDIA